MEKTPKLTQEQHKEETLRSAAIMHAIEMSSTFKLYSFRIIDHNQFVSRTKELIDQFAHQIKSK